MNIVLVGFMGAGKTTVGRMLAARLGYRFLDIDDCIEREQGCRVADLFERKGQAWFRKQETDVLKRLTKVQNMVIATGGGLLTTPGNAELLKRIGICIHLTASVEKLYERTARTDNRPLLKTANPYATMAELYDKRKDLYKMAEITIDTESLYPSKTAGEIIKKL